MPSRCQLRPALSFRYVNAASSVITGYGPDEIYADPARLVDAIHPDDRALVASAFADAGRLEAPVIFRFRHRNGEWRWFEVFATPVLDEAGRVAAVDGIARDVTVRHRLEEQFRLLAERSPEMVYRLRLEPDCATEYVSPACEAVTGRSPEEFYSDPWLLLGTFIPMTATCSQHMSNGRSTSAPARSDSGSFTPMDPSTGSNR